MPLGPGFNLKAATSPKWLVLYLSALVASQRIHLSWLSAIICLIPVGMAFFVRTDKAQRNTLLIAAVFMSVDLGGEVYPETPAVIRYGIYLYILWLMAVDVGLYMRRLIVALLCITVPFALMLINSDTISLQTLWRDLLLLSLLVIVSCSGQKTLSRYELDYEHLAIIITVFLLGEVFNILSGATLEGEYLSYTSLKSLVVFPAFYLLSRGKYYSGIVASAVTFWVLLYYAARMISLTFLLVLMGLLTHKIFQNRRYAARILILSSLIIVIVITSINSDFLYNKMEGSRFGSMFITVIENMDSNELLRLVDPVRYEELQLFFDRPLFEIIFGSGLGVGIADHEGLLDFLPYENTAFSAEEMDSRVFHEFHDMPIDICLRLGLWPLFIVLWHVMHHIYSTEPRIALLSQLLFVLLFCAFFSSAGLISIALIALILRKALNYKSQRELLI